MANDNTSLQAFFKEKTQREIYDSINVKFMSEAELVKAGVPVTLAGLRSQNPQELKSTRDARNAKAGKTAEKKLFNTAPEPAAVADVMVAAS